MLRLIRKIFGYSNEPEIIDVKLNQHIEYIDNIEKNKVIGNILKNVIDNKENTFVSYTEEAMDKVTNNRYKFIKYREIL